MRLLLTLLLLLPVLVLAQSTEDCMMCHSDPDLTGLDRNEVEVSMYVDTEHFEQSIHSGMECVDCHQELAGVEEFPHAEQIAPVECAVCHDDAAEEYAETMHGLKFLDMTELAPRCWDCHGKHDILPSDDPEAKTYFQNLPQTCGDCHKKIRNVNGLETHTADVGGEYLKGVHGQLVEEGIDAAPTCNTCHPAHAIRKRIDPQSTIYKLNVSETCGNCHIDELSNFSESIHARALRHGILESATCTDCHGEHEILPAQTAFIKTGHDACIDCHNNPRIFNKYDLPKSVVSTYVDSYHGLSVRLGQDQAATCASCHGHHAIFSADEPYSSVHPANLVQTCSKCHDNVTPSFAKSYTHEAMLIRGNPINYWITVIYILLIVGIIGAMLIHNMIIFIKYIRYKKNEEKQYFIIRFKKAEIWQHAVLAITFTILAISGFALKFPDAWWVDMFRAVGINEWGRRVIHRVSAVLMVIASVYHLYYIFFTERGRHLFKAILPNKQDGVEIWQTVKYYMGFSKKRPRYDEFDYTEKVEYWAVVWGTFIMALTGLVLWVPEVITSFLPSWSVRVAELIHYYEAILATQAIVVFHLFFVIVHPEQYPMNLSWLTGKMSLRAALRKHPRWVERIAKTDECKELLPEKVQKNCEGVEDIENYMKFGELYNEIKKGKVY
ncbi:MAG: cytochrome b/b6 domain-containing protein [Calditrichia bacterium]